MSFFGIIVFSTLIVTTDCSAYIKSIRGYAAALYGIFVAIGIVASIIVFVISYISKINSNFKNVFSIAIPPIFLVIYIIAAKNIATQICHQ